MNLAWNTSFMWDGGVFNLDLQPIAPITNFVEMDDSVSNVLERLRNHASYPAMFRKAFGDDQITTTYFLKALSQFMLMCVSSNSLYDEVQRGEAVFSESEKQGHEIFQNKCSGCHAEPMFTDFPFRNNGLTASSKNDKGRYAVTLQDADMYKFKVPSLRNLRFTPPYMHDGRFLTLNAVLDHYREEVHPYSNLDPLLRQNDEPGIPLSDDEKVKLLAFLETLNDPGFVTNKMLAEPH